MKKLAVVSAGVSHPSTSRHVADTIAAAVSSAVTGRGEALDTTTIEVRDYAADLARLMTSGISSGALDSVREELSASDGLVAVTPVFQASMSGLFKMFFDALDPEALTGMPAIIAATAGTARHSLVTEYAMRPLLTYMRAIVVPTSLFFATEDFGGTGFSSRASRAAAELADHMVRTHSSVEGLAQPSAPQPQRTRRSGVDPEEDFVPFSELLRGHTGGDAGEHTGDNPVR
ncbi:CE1759 family FMN reductase [Corynebacterium liangguodongii]|uniref:Oxidoreductase n=1 Tax=Corynebacterium liangguodongii TaxID=2079535 RepID=A0A2S0WEB4_9CORY|nr:CE1759 family FMN reductase [Corynebacterium liangguodongii]AWB84111.1 oxidoreductase [Corynebacterium liangguodongii]PWC00122.1 oxidoreductase [Corynebacterium liangguodongii]